MGVCSSRETSVHEKMGIFSLSKLSKEQNELVKQIIEKRKKISSYMDIIHTIDGELYLLGFKNYFKVKNKIFQLIDSKQEILTKISDQRIEIDDIEKRLGFRLLLY